MMRAIEKLQFPDVVPATIVGMPPTIREVPPTSLYVDETYQRSLSERSIRLIRKIVAEWSWHAFKPPIVVEANGRFEVIDGQHTAIAAITHGGIDRLPVMIVEADAVASKASAFVRHNRDRIQVTPVQLYVAMVAAGDEDALTVGQVCERAGVRILRMPPAMGRYQVGDTMAISTVRSLVSRRYAKGAREVLEVCVKAGCAPVSAAMIKAVDYLLHAPEYKGELDADRIALVVSVNLASIDREAELFSKERRVPQWRALASVIYMNRRKTRQAR